MAIRFWLQLVGLLLCASCLRAQSPTFVHPGGLHNQADLDRMKEKVAAREHPWIDDWERLLLDPLARADYQPHPQANMGVSRQVASKDAHAAYLNALRWCISGDQAYAACAVRICNAWSAKVDQVPTGTDILGLSGIPITEFALVGELLCSSPDWKAEDFSRFKRMMLTYWYPVAHDFLTRHNGADPTNYWANWDLSNVGALVAIGVLCDDRAIFEEGVDYFRHGAGMGSIGHAVPYLHPDGLGQWQESGRDQPHAELGVGLMAQICEVAWKQGVDLYGESENRLLAGAEYVAQWDQWKPVPYRYYTNAAHAHQNWPSINGRGRLNRPVWELLYNHYVVRRGLAAPNTQAMAALVRPEPGSIDHFGYGTLTFTLEAAKSPYPPAPVPPAPTGLTATPGAGRVFLRWTRNGDTAQGYEVRRATGPDDPYQSIASWADNTRCEYTDLSATAGMAYRYVVAARNQAGTGGASEAVEAMPAVAGELPPGWTPGNVGGPANGNARFADASGGTFLVAGAGSGIGGTADGWFGVSRSVSGDCVVTARLVEVNWKGGELNAKAGIVMRASSAPDAPALVMKLGGLGARQAGLGIRSTRGGKMAWTGGNDYTWVPTWFRLERTGNLFTAYESSDGEQWFRVGESTVPMSDECLMGLVVASNSEKAISAYFDHVSVEGKP